jgi:two-component system response regulator BaeR
MSKKHILIVEDEERIATLVGKYLELEGYNYTCLHSGDGAVETIRELQPALCILDIMLPGMSGLEICSQVRRFSQLPIIMLTARVDEIDRLIGFKQGADDYLCKPFSPKELMARVNALLRRSQPILNAKVLTFRELTLDDERFSLHYKDQAIKFTVNEFNILKTLMTYPEKVFSRRELLYAVKHHELEIYERTIDSHIKNVRKKLSLVSQGESFIVSIYGLGYSLKEQ